MGVFECDVTGAVLPDCENTRDFLCFVQCCFVHRLQRTHRESWVFSDDGITRHGLQAQHVLMTARTKDRGVPLANPDANALCQPAGARYQLSDRTHRSK